MIVALRHLWRHRLLVGAGLIVALVMGVSVSYHVGFGFPPTLTSKQQGVGFASSKVLVDSPSSQTVDLGGGSVTADVAAMTSRARLLANIMATSPLKDEIARRAGIDPRSFSAISPSLGEDTPRPSAGAANPKAYVMSVYFNEALPIVTADVQAADRATASRIAAAAADTIVDYVHKLAALDDVALSHRLVIRRMGPPLAETRRTSERHLFAAFVFLITFSLWCSMIFAGMRLRGDGARRSRRVRAAA